MPDAPAVTASTLELLAWISRRPRTYRETIEAWVSNCPRLSTWDDAVGGGLVEVVRDSGGVLLVSLTPHGVALLESATAEPRAGT